MSAEERNILIQNLNFKLIARSIICEDYGLELDEHGEVNMEGLKTTTHWKTFPIMGIIKTVYDIKSLIEHNKEQNESKGTE